MQVMEEKTKHNLLIKFDVEGMLSYLSHQETSDMLKRALVRAEIKTVYSRGFNPRPKMSLPLPRTVGITSRGDILCVKVEEDRQPEEIMEMLNETLPPACRVTEVCYSESGKTPKPQLADYIFSIDPRRCPEQLKSHILCTRETLRAGRHVVIERKTPGKRKTKQIDVNSFVDDIELNDNRLSVRCKISESGSIRVDELQNIFHVPAETLDGPVTRDNVKWITN